MRVAAILALIFLVPATTFAQQDDESRTREYSQSPAVRARFADVPIKLDAPGLAPDRDTFTSQEEMIAFVARMAARARNLHVGSLGKSQEGRDLPYLVFTAEGSGEAAAIKGRERPIVWLVGQQHGNEPAGGEAMLALASALADGELKPLLDRITVVIVPRANPDGAAAFVRGSANGFDLNRDHLLLTLPETRGLHAKMAELPPDMVIDAHEFSVANRWIEKFNALQGADAMFLHATHPAVARETTGLAENLFRPAMEAALTRHGLKPFWYLTTSFRVEDKTVSMGGNAPGISRNHFGLTGAVSFLVETRGVGIRREGYQRRVATHYVAARAALETAAAEAPRVRMAVMQARQAIAAARDDLVVGHRIATVKMTLPMVDPETAADKPVEVDFRDSRKITVTATRPRPAGYIVAPEAGAAVEALRTKGVLVCKLGGSQPVDVEAFRVESRAGPVTRDQRESINPERAVNVTLSARKLEAAPGSMFIPMGQPAAAIIAATLEPDSPGSHVGSGMTPVLASGEAPIYRVPAGARSAHGC
jgi:predicted deacylase